MINQDEFKPIFQQVVTLRKKPLLVLSISINRRIAVQVQKLLRDKIFDELDVILQTPGGDPDAAFNITKLLRKHSKKINILVPIWAKSAGTLICLGADTIVMSEIAELGPLDTQIPEKQDGDGDTYKSALNGFRALEQIQAHVFDSLFMAETLILKRTGLKISEVIKLAIEFSSKTAGSLYAQLDPKVIGEYARALEIGEHYGIRVLTDYMKWDSELAKETVSSLVYKYPSHGYIIDHDELIKLGLPAEEMTNDLTGILLESCLKLTDLEDSYADFFDYTNQ